MRCLLIYMLLCLATGFPGAFAQSTAEQYKVENITIAKTASNADEARMQALDEAEMQAFKTLLTSLDVEASRAESFTKAQIDMTVLNFEVKQEKISDTTYSAVLDYSFSIEKVQSLLKSEGVMSLVQKSPPVLVLPIVQEIDRATVWDTTHLWYQAWQGVTEKSKIVPLVLSLGDLEDIRLISADEAMAGDRQKLAALAAKYHVNKILIAALKEEADFVALVLFDKGQIVSTGQINIAGDDPEYEDAASQSVRFLEDEWKSKNVMQAQAVAGMSAKTIRTVILVKSAQDWKETKKRIEQWSELEKIEVRQISAFQVVADIYYKNTLEEFKGFIEGQGFSLSEQPDNSWVLYTN